MTIPVYQTDHGPVVNPLSYNPATYDASTDGPIFAWKYAHWGYEFKAIEAWIEFAQATSMDEFGQGIKKLADYRFSRWEREAFIQNLYNWFQNLNDASMPQTASDIIVQALDTVLTDAKRQSLAALAASWS